MPATGITEIAHLRLLSPTTINDTDLRSKLARVIHFSERYTGYRFYYLQQKEDPSLLYLIGHWDTLEQHMDGFIPSEENQSLLESLKGLLNVEWLLHVDFEGDRFPDLRGEEDREEDVVWGIARFFVKEGQRENFVGRMGFEGKDGWGSGRDGRSGGGWRVGKDGEKEEFVSFNCKSTGWDYSGVVKFTDDVDVKHAKFLPL